MASDFEPIGVHLDLTKVPVQDFFSLGIDPSSRSPMFFTYGWGFDYVNGSSWFGPLASGAAIAQPWGGNLSLLGASPGDLAGWGYDITAVPSLDTKIDACVATTGQAQFECWAQADQY